MDNDAKLPRIYVEAPLGDGLSVPLDADQAHYLKNVMRRNDGDPLRIFNGRDGEWRANLSNLSKKGGTLDLSYIIKPQPPLSRRVHLYFAPVKKTAMDWMIEKAVELGATDLHPVLTQNTEVRKLNDERLTKQVLEAAEQCERLFIPVLHPILPLERAFNPDIPVLACIERENTPDISRSVPKNGDIGILIGPEGGFTAEEKSFLREKAGVTAVSLGDSVLRAETAACYALIAARIA